jgi:predicted nucleotidyltransferase
MADVAVPPLRALVESLHREIKALAARHRARAIAIFGSVARGDEGPGSDIDFLVEFEPGSSLFDLVRLKADLSDLLGREVDVVSLGGLLPRDDDVRREAVWL